MKEVKEVDVTGVRYRLMQYTRFKNDVEKWEDQILDLRTRINKVASRSPKKLPEGGEVDAHWRSDLFDEIENCQKLIAGTQAMIDIIEDFVRCLPEERDQNIFNDLYLNGLGLTQEDVGDKYGYTRNGLQKRVNKLIKRHWKY